MAWPGWRRWGLNHCSASISRSPGPSEPPSHILKLSSTIYCQGGCGNSFREICGLQRTTRRWGLCRGQGRVTVTPLRTCFLGQPEWKGSRLFPNIKLHPTLFLLCAQIWLISISLRLPIIHPLLNRAVHFIWQGEFFKNLGLFLFSQSMTGKSFLVFFFLLLPWVCRGC